MTTSHVEQRHNGLRHHLSSRAASRSVDEVWLRHRFAAYCERARWTIELVVTRSAYAARTGRTPPATSIGMTHRDPVTARRVVFLDLARLRTRGQAELELVHEVMHARWWSYRHRPIAFTRAQQLIDALAAESR